MTTVSNKTNSLVFKTSRANAKMNAFVTIRLNDECKNGHQDFAITANIYEAGKPTTDRYMISGGCCHDEILKLFPEFKIFVNLHLCDYNGVPMYAIVNGFYHMQNGFTDAPAGSDKFKKEFCEYYRITGNQFDILSKAKNKVQYAKALTFCDILKQWKDEAIEAIKLLENLTGKEFVIDSVKTQLDMPTPEQFKEEEDRVKNGYYTPEAEQGREQAKKNEVVKKLQAERDKDIDKANKEYAAKLAVLNAGGTKALENCIYYNHTSQIAFNWRGYDKLSNETIETIKAVIVLPEGVTIDNGQK